MRFFFSFLVFPLAWKFLQLSTRPSRVSCGHTHTRVMKHERRAPVWRTTELSNLEVLLPLALSLGLLLRLDLLFSLSLPAVTHTTHSHQLIQTERRVITLIFCRRVTVTHDYRCSVTCVFYRSCMSFASLSFLLISSSAKSFMVCL